VFIIIEAVVADATEKLSTSRMFSNCFSVLFKMKVLKDIFTGFLALAAMMILFLFLGKDE